MVRLAVYDDIENIYFLIHNFLRDADPNSRMDSERLMNALSIAIVEHAIFVMETDEPEIVGALGLHVAPVFWASDLTATELFWYVAENHRGTAESKELYHAAEAWAKANGCHAILMGALATSPEKVRKFYEAQGFTELQTGFTKRLSNG